MRPRISVLIATYNRAKILRETLEAMTNLVSPPGGWELIVIDNNSTDHTKSVCSEFAEALPIRYVFERQQGKNYALNTGFELARGDLLVFTDDDVTPDSRWLLEHVGASKKWQPYTIFLGSITCSWPDDTPDLIRRRVVQWLDFTSSPVAQKKGPLPSGHCGAGANFAVRRSIIDEGFRYDPRVGPCGTGRIAGSETELQRRLFKAGHRAVYVPDAKIVHRVRSIELGSAALRNRSWGFGRGTGFRTKDQRGQWRCICGIPLWVLKKVLLLGFTWVAKKIRKDTEGVFVAKHKLIFHLGMISYWRSYPIKRTEGAAR